MRRGGAALLVTALATASVGVVVLDGRLGAVRVATGDGLALRVSEQGGITAVGDGGRTLPGSGARGGFEVRAVGGQPNLLANPGFEEADGDLPEGWSLVDGDGELALDGARPHGGERSVRITLPEPGTSAGLIATVDVEPDTEYTLSAWIRTEGIGPTGTSVSVNPPRVTVVEQGADGPRPKAYAFGYTDDSEWSRHDAGFRTGEDAGSVRILVEVRDGWGSAWFDDVTVARLADAEAREVKGPVSRSGDGLTLRGEPLDGVALEARVLERDDHLAVEGVLEGTDGGDHAVQVSFTLPLDAEGWQWWEDVRRGRPIEDGETYATLSSPTRQAGPEPFAGLNQIQRSSIYPFGGISRGGTGLGIGVPMDRPRVSRVTADADGLTITFDLGVSPAAMGSRADFGFVLFRTDGRWGFRAVAERYYRLFPSSFERRTEANREGAWFFAPPLESLPGDAARDFGLGLHTIALGKAPTQTYSEWGTKYVRWSNDHGVYASAYTHHWAFFLPQARPIDHASLLATVRERAASEGRLADEARAALESTARDVNGRRLYEVYRTYHAFYQNHDAGGPWSDTVLEHQVRRAIRLAAEAGGRLDGIHMDSTSGARRWGAVNDFDRSHWAAATVPLTFSYANGRVAQLGALTMHAHISRLADWVHDRGLILSANFNSGRERTLGWLGADRIDYFGIEQGLPDKVGGIDNVDRLALIKRTLARHRPVTTLDYSIGYREVTGQEIDDRIEQSLFYGIYPGAWVREENENDQTVVTWSTPENRAIFGRYAPAFRALAAAGWEPVTLARSDNAKVWVERYGGGDGGVAYLALRNETDQEQAYRITLDAPLARVVSGASDLVSGAPVPLRDGVIAGRLAPRQTLVVVLEPAG